MTKKVAISTWCTDDYVDLIGLDKLHNSIKHFHPEIDGGVTRHLFGLSTPHLKHDIKTSIITCLKNFEPRVIVQDVVVAGDLDKNGFNVSIFFTVINSPEPIEVSLFLERIR